MKIYFIQERTDDDTRIVSSYYSSKESAQEELDALAEGNYLNKDYNKEILTVIDCFGSVTEYKIVEAIVKK